MQLSIQPTDLEEPTVQAARSELFRRLLNFCQVLKAAGLGVTPRRLIDLFRALPYIDLLQADDFRWALRSNLVSSREEEQAFDRLFDAFWFNSSRLEEVATEIELEPRENDQNREYPEAPPDELGSPQHWSRDEVSRDLNLSSRLQTANPATDRMVRELAKRLATRPSRRRQASRHGDRIDLRRSLRRSARYGMDLVELGRTRRRVRKTRLVLLCDVSGSMDTYNPFLLELMLGIQKALKNSRTVVFSTRATEIGATLRQRSVRETLSKIAKCARHWSGGTDIGEGLASMNRRILREGTPRSTVAIILSDGYDQGDTDRIDSEMRALRRRVRKVVWINPLLGTKGYAPIAKGMRAALPHVDHFLPAHDIASLKSLCTDLARV